MQNVFITVNIFGALRWLICAVPMNEATHATQLGKEVLGCVMLLYGK